MLGLGVDAPTHPHDGALNLVIGTSGQRDSSPLQVRGLIEHVLPPRAVEGHADSNLAILEHLDAATLYRCQQRGCRRDVVLEDEIPVSCPRGDSLIAVDEAGGCLTIVRDRVSAPRVKVGLETAPPAIRDNVDPV